MPDKDVCAFPLACRCYSDHPKLDIPKLFNIVKDPSEKYSINISVAKYAKIVEKINKATEEHRKTTEGLTSQMTYLNNIGGPFKLPFCSFPSKRQCQDEHNALNYTPKYFKG